MIESGFDAWYAPPPTIVSLQTPIWPDAGTSKGELAKTEVAPQYAWPTLRRHQPGTRSKLDPQHIVEVFGDH